MSITINKKLKFLKDLLTNVKYTEFSVTNRNNKCENIILVNTQINTVVSDNATVADEVEEFSCSEFKHLQYGGYDLAIDKEDFEMICQVVIEGGEIFNPYKLTMRFVYNEGPKSKIYSFTI